MNKGLICLILNLVFPGLGTLVAGEKERGIWQVVLWWGGLWTFWLGIGLLAMPVAWIWALIDGLRFNRELSGNVSKGAVCLVLNVYVPGVGSLLGGLKDNGIWQVVLYYGGMVLSSLGIGVFAMPVGWIWAFIDGLKMNDTLTEEI